MFSNDGAMVTLVETGVDLNSVVLSEASIALREFENVVWDRSVW